MKLEQLKALPPERKSRERKYARQRLTMVLRLMVKPLPADARAYLSGYLDMTRKALEALS
jgi:hypothetical protein